MEGMQGYFLTVKYSNDVDISLPTDPRPQWPDGRQHCHVVTIPDNISYGVLTITCQLGTFLMQEKFLAEHRIDNSTCPVTDVKDQGVCDIIMLC